MATIVVRERRAMPRGQGRGIAIAGLVLTMILAALLAVIGVLRGAPGAPPSRAVAVAVAAAPAATLPKEPPPPVQPTVLADLTMDAARASNAAVPIAAPKLPAAPRFVYAGTPQDRDAALTCLAAAVLYEAGDDATGERAVAQVVLNRLRHPAFPKTVCGVVFQGSERATGCQFTFTCDGALDRPPRAAAWMRARAVAEIALSGFVDKAVGAATHYHADWVVPYWRDTLVKLAQVHTHIFYRWPGGWGSPGALVGRVQPFERLDPRLVPLAGPEQTAIANAGVATIPTPAGEIGPAPPRETVEVAGVSKAALSGSIVRLADADGRQYVLQLAPGTPAASYASAAAALCRGKPDCLVFGWLNPVRMPRRLPILPMGLQGMSFMYRKNSLLHSERPYWNCQQKPRDDAAECLPGTR